MKNIKPFINDPTRYLNEPPWTHAEKMLRLAGITSVVGYNMEAQSYYRKMADVNPELIIEYNMEEFNSLPSVRRNSLLANFKNMVPPWREEDVVSQTG